MHNINWCDPLKRKWVHVSDGLINDTVLNLYSYSIFNSVRDLDSCPGANT